MKPRIAIFGLPPASTGRLQIWLYANPTGTTSFVEIFRASNDESGRILDYVFADIEIGCSLMIKIMSSGICEYSYALEFNGADISHVPIFEKENNTTKDLVEKDWNIELWGRWNPNKQQQDGLTFEKECLNSRTISVTPVWESYYFDSNIDYFEKFHKLWIGLNAYATHWTGESQDKEKILALVKSDLCKEFNRILGQVKNQESADKWRALQQSTGLNMTSDIVRDEIAMTCHGLAFLELAKLAIGPFSDIAEQLDGLVFLDNGSGKEVFRSIFSGYHEFMASENGRVLEFDLADAFSEPRAPRSVKRFGRLVFHDPTLPSNPGDLFSLKNYFGSQYETTPYLGQTKGKLKKWEEIDPLFFRYLYVLYKFRCAYFHGDFPTNKENNELARTAYQSPQEIFPAIF